MKNQIILKASSPDEVALVNFARYCDIEFTGVDENNDITVREKNTQLKYKILHIFEFDSTRYHIFLFTVILIFFPSSEKKENVNCR